MMRGWRYRKQTLSWASQRLNWDSRMNANLLLGFRKPDPITAGLPTTCPQKIASTVRGHTVHKPFAFGYSFKAKHCWSNALFQDWQTRDNPLSPPNKEVAFTRLKHATPVTAEHNDKIKRVRKKPKKSNIYFLSTNTAVHLEMCEI